jgi:hypothetical protein
MQERYGYVGSFGSKLNEKIASTLWMRFGVKHAMQASAVREKVSKTNLIRYGHIHNIHCRSFVSPFTRKDVQNKAQVAIYERFGCHCAANSRFVKFNRRERFLKAYETKRKTGKLLESRPEVQLRNALIDVWGNTNILIHTMLNGWSMDILIVPLNTYVQVDGVYWHGLNRDITSIKTSISCVDKAIYKKWLRDREQDIWFTQQSTLHLTRITDVEILKTDIYELLRIKALLPDSITQC